MLFKSRHGFFSFGLFFCPIRLQVGGSVFYSVVNDALSAEKIHSKLQFQ